MNRWDKVRFVIIVLGVVFTAATIGIWFLTFLMAYFNPPMHYALVFVNNVGEKDLELILFIFLLPCMVYTCFYAVRAYLRDTYE